jgi:hypothetical protein
MRWNLISDWSYNKEIGEQIFFEHKNVNKIAGKWIINDKDQNRLVIEDENWN